MPALFITLEGGEGSGKSTQIKRLAARLEAQGHDLLVTREPGGTPEAEAVRALLVSGDVARWTAKSEALLNYAAREQHLEQVIRPALAAGLTVLCDRFMDSTRAYQGYAGGCESEFIDALEAKAKGLVNRVVPADALDAEVERLAGSILAKSAVAIRIGKGMYYKQLEMGLTEAYDYAGEVMACNMMSEDAGEGIDAFMQKRKPEYKGF